MKSYFRLTKKYSYETLGFIFLVIVMGGAMFSPRGEELTKRAYDPLRHTESRKEVVVVGIDDKSLQALGAWPWDRDIFANLTQRLLNSEVKALGFDVLFLEPRKGDDLFKRVLENSKTPIMLGAKNTKEDLYASYLVTGTSSYVTSAIVNVIPDPDGKVRVFPQAVKHEGGCLQPLAQKIFNKVTFKDVSFCEKEELSYFRYSNSITTYSAIDVISGAIPSELLKNKIVLIGSSSLDLNDYFVSLRGEKIAGIYVHASILTSLLNNERDVDVPPYISIVLLLIVAVASSAIILFIRRVLYQIAGVIFLCVSVLVLAATLFSYKYSIPLPWLLGIIIISAGYSILFKIRHEKKQGDYVRNLFSKYVNKDILQELLASTAPISLTGEKRDVTVLFSDLRGFTTFSEGLQPEELMSLLNGYFSAMTSPILEENGTVDKFIGDAIMAFWNAPLTVQNHETHAVLAAIKMVQALKVFNEKEGTNLHMGIGLHRGEAVVGNVGGEDRVNYTALGDTINLGSRLEGLTKKYGVTIIISEDVMERLERGKFLLRKLDEVTVKGKNKSTILYEVVTEKETTHVRIEKYERAFSLYQQGDFENAMVIFSKLKEEGDGPSSLMTERIPLLEKGVEWKGVYSFDEK